MIDKLKALLGFVERRLVERSTLTDLGAAAAAGSVLPWPWSLVSFLVLAGKAFIPDGEVKG